MSTEMETRRRAKPVTYDELYPGRFLKAGELRGKKVTLTIADVDLEELEGEDGKKKAKATMSFRETEKQMVMCKTNGICCKTMFGTELAKWIGKRVTIFPGEWNGEPAIRVWGSPDIERDIDLQVSLPRRRPFTMKMHKVGAPAKPPAAATPPADDAPPADPDFLRGYDGARQ